ncbi:MAG TPA: thioredoxin TrxC [Hellea balneolensis]|uniref:Thioredoxin n=1 Tax=Hellea balneolensis TaxID=287478 RepID=A0A7V5NXP7_9PROT|nr:thioredoxin TrxC [Hellea balneolensis]
MSKTNQIVCPHCMAVNRIPANKPATSAKCGKCKKPLFGDHPAELTDATFDKFVSKTSVPVVVDFWAPWCGPCKMMAPEYAKAAKAVEPKARFAKLNTQDNQHTATKHRIQGIPALIIFKNGQPVAHLAGARPAGEIRSWVESNI